MNLNRSAHDAEVVANIARPGVVGSGGGWNNAPGVFWSGEPHPAGRVHHTPGNSGSSQRPGNHQNTSWRIWAIVFSASGFIGGIVAIVEALRK